MFYNALMELEGGYVTAFAYDCQWTGAKNMDFKTFSQKWGCGRDSYQPHFSIWRAPDVRINPYTGKRMPLQQLGFRSTEVSQPRIKDWFTQS